MRRFITILVIILLLGVGIGAFMLFGKFSEGERAGTMVKLSKKGVIFKTWEGELNLGMFIGDMGAANNNRIWEFSVEPGNDEAVQVIQEAVGSGKRVKLYYYEAYLEQFWRGDTKYFVYKAEIQK